MFHNDEMMIITDEQQVLRIEGQLKEIVAGTIHEGLKIYKQAGLLAMPVETGLHFDEMDKIRLAHAVQMGSNTVLYASALEYPEHIPRLLAFPPTINGIERFDKECATFNYALFLDASMFVVLCLTEDANILIGSQDFIEQSIGASLEEGYATFYAYASFAEWPPLLRERFLYIYHLLKEDYTNAQPGSYVLL